MFGIFKKIFGGKPEPDSGLGVDVLARRLGLSIEALRAVVVVYHEFDIPKRTGGKRTIAAPDEQLKQVQRLILHKLLKKLHAHSAATGFETGHSIVSNALPHTGKRLVVRLDIRDFFGSTTASRVEQYFRALGWSGEAAALLTKLCTHKGALPQGAPTSPRLSNLVNVRFDSRLSGYAKCLGLSYSRYADDMTFSGGIGRNDDDEPDSQIDLIYRIRNIVADEGYRLHTDKKLRLARRHERQVVTGLVVNEKVQLPRAKRRWLRAVEHHVKNGRPATLTPEQLAGWRSLQAMIANQADASRKSADGSAE